MRPGLQLLKAIHSPSNPPAAWDLGVDAMLSIGVARAPEGQLEQWLGLLHQSPSPCLCVDVPSGLHADTGSGR